VQDIELPAELAKETAASGGPYTPPPPGAPPSQRWAAKSKLAVELCAAGGFPAAARMLELQLGIVNLEPLKDNMLAASSAAFTYVSGMAGLPPMCVGLDSSWTKSTPTPDAPTTPVTPFKMPAMETALRAAYKSVTDGKFQEAKDGFQNILVTLPLVTVETRRQVDEVKELVSIAREYHTFTRCELTGKTVRL
jgi:coatomer subunit alpha